MRLPQHFGFGVLVGSGILVGWMGIALAAPLVAPAGPLALGGPPLVAPFTESGYWLGTDTLGRDMTTAVIYAARTSLSVATAATLSTMALGSAIGLAAALGGRLMDGLAMRVTEAVQTVPPFLAALAIAGTFGATSLTVVVAIALTAWPQVARLVRAEALRVAEMDYVAAARLQGLSGCRLALTVILPASLGPVAALVGVFAGEAILIESALGFLGLSDPNSVSWGSLVAEGRALVRTSPHLVIVPGLAIVSAVLATSLVSNKPAFGFT